MAPMSSTVVSATGARFAGLAVPQSGPSPGPHPAPAPDLDGEDLESGFSVVRRKERLVRLPNHLKPCEGNS